MMFNIVDFPLPLSPMSDVTSPGAIEKLTWRTAGTAPLPKEPPRNDFDRFSRFNMS
jgi:hypothetical protein